MWHEIFREESGKDDPAQRRVGSAWITEGSAMRVHINTLGCRLNQAESEQIAQQFRLAGHELVADAAEADLLVVNSCTVTRDAGRKSRRAARPMRGGQRVVVTGCHSEVRPQEFAAADLIVASAEKERLASLAAEQFGLEGSALGADFRPDARLALYPLVLDKTRAFVKIQDGCNLSCSFCLTTIARGAARSQPPGEIVCEVTLLAQQGCQEVVLTGVHAGSYGYDRGTDLGQLIERLLSETTIPRLRLSSLEPWNFKSDWLELWQRFEGRLCRHLHMSLQSGSDTVLRRMRRAYSSRQFAAKVAAARAAIPNLAVTTDIIVGFPGETEAEHAASVAFVEVVGFAGAHIFSFSPRPGTRAAAMRDQVDGATKRARHAEMSAVTLASAARFRESMVGQQLPVLWEQPRPDGVATGLTDTYLRVYAAPGTRERNTVTLAHFVSVHEDGLWAESPSG
ncbi:MAG TPA: tRNA (N(6)-L-threonylcarbamoyladenosine(37)-C(2))-methylthiotransferase MtaB [Chloroflexi bacterium]|nr:tRNA (N(6)-L-threonylcarbamoyladenosine(37)-C(2))-methylthiotransferase MtaB [Chloroflexota bacterium]